MKRLLLIATLALSLAALGFGTNRAGQKNIHDPANAVANLDVHPELQATLFASEPKITNPTNLDIDHRGRVWICDVKNYRGNNGRRPEGDRILILEDTNGDGVADNVKTFYQGRDIDSAMGICVLGNKVIVSASPNVFVFTFDENDKVLKKEVLFTKTGHPPARSLCPLVRLRPRRPALLELRQRRPRGPRQERQAGRRSRRQRRQRFGPAVPARHGLPLRHGRQPTSRCSATTSATTTRSAVDSFGTIWQSDNDDDGNRGVRINYVMEYGNFGYVDEMTGAGWQTKRTNMEKEIPLRHWHQNDPGVVPNLLQTGGGSPTGICVYEGKLLPKVFHNQIIHCDAGPSVVRSYPVVPDGAGYKVTKIVNILDGSKQNNWFRPADVCVAPDGSIFVTDWYDPGVGGHGQRDLDRGRIFRVAPPGVKYTVPKTDFTSVKGNIEALKSPNLATRYIAWTNLKKLGTKAKEALWNLYDSSKNPREQARAMWLLGQIPGEGAFAMGHVFQTAGDPNVRIAALRLARQLKLDIVPYAIPGVFDESFAVRRECAIALRHSKSPKAPVVWADLASRHDGGDRWYLEALGIGADKNWDNCLEAYLKLRKFAKDSKAYRDIVWRSRAKATPGLLAEIVAARETPGDEIPRLLRAFDLQPASDAKDRALMKLAVGNRPTWQTFIATEAIGRLKGVTLKTQPQLAGALNASLDRMKGTSAFVDLVGKFGLADRYPEVLALAQKHPTEQLGVDAMRMLMERDQKALVRKALAGDKEQAIATAQALGSAGHERATELLLPIVRDAKRDAELRRQATRALARNRVGAMQLIKLARSNQLDPSLKPAAGSALSVAPWRDLRKQISELFPAPAGKDNRPLPSINQLVRMRGNAASGKMVFAKAGTCAKCHVVNGEGKEVGPNLSEIGKKLSREAIYEAILYPSAEHQPQLRDLRRRDESGQRGQRPARQQDAGRDHAQGRRGAVAHVQDGRRGVRYARDRVDHAGRLAQGADDAGVGGRGRVPANAAGGAEDRRALIPFTFSARSPGEGRTPLPLASGR